MNDQGTKEINNHWVRLVIIWIVWVVILGVFAYVLIREVRKPGVLVAPKAPLTEINVKKAEEVRERLDGR